MKAFKIVAGLVVAVIAIAAVAVVLVLQNLDQMIKTVVEESGSEVLGTEVRLESSKITLKEGRGELHNLTIANPPGFSQDSAFSLGEIALDIDLKSLGGDVIVLNEVLVSDAHLLVEEKALTQINVQTLMDNVKKNTASGKGSNTSGEQAADSESMPAEETKLAIEKFTLQGINMRIITAEWGERSLTLPPLQLTNLGSRDNGLTPEEMTQAIIKPVLAKAEKAAKDELQDLAKEKAEEKLKEKLSEEDSEKLDQLKSLFGR
ncbi:hypothetical protein KOI40_09460 [Aestuariicella sp. G3-2]|uniref:hypothetical protein n=1 Tax=Pseudomaricurvus albidus TaxID=2842452 RepID=UPI001C0B520E|nr:hypothetical protein [Aestuariicella albida]MBU3070049.1 hypothetical protein [Aestuariicella albida]